MTDVFVKFQFWMESVFGVLIAGGAEMWYTESNTGKEENVMNEGTIFGFVLWMAGALLLVGIGVSAFFAKKEVGFFCNVEALPMNNVKAYNRAVGKLFVVYGIVFSLLGLPLLAEQGSGVIILSILGVVGETIAAMAVYILVIQSKYEKKP